MSILNFLSVFKPVAELIDDLHTSEEERQTLKLHLAEVEAKVATKLMDLQMSVIESNADVAKAEQEHGNLLSRSWRPIVSIGMMGMLFSMGLGFIPFNDLLAQIAGGFLGIYGIGRSIEKKKKNS